MLVLSGLPKHSPCWLWWWLRCDGRQFSNTSHPQDIYSGIPLLFALRSSGNNVHLWNLAFTDDDDIAFDSPAVVPKVLYKVSATNKVKQSHTYFPELYLAQYLKQKCNVDLPVYTAIRTGVKLLTPAFQQLIDELHIDAVVLIDGGTDSLMFGNECQLATPQEDMLSIKSVFDCKVAKKFLVCLGFGIDHFHGVCHSLFLQNVAQLIQDGGYLGVFSVQREMAEFKRFQEAVAYASERMELSIVATSVVNAGEGHFGDYHATERTKGSKLFINPLMSMYWCFQLDSVAKRVIYLDSLADTTNFQQVHDRITQFRRSLPAKEVRNYVAFPH